jgi:hypothetical protein
MPTGREAPNIPDIGDQGGRCKQSNAGNRDQVLDDRKLTTQQLKLPLCSEDATLKLEDLHPSLVQKRSECVGNPGVGVFELIPDNIPFLGNLDEAGAVALLLMCLRYFGLDVTKIFEKRSGKGVSDGEGQSS